MTDSSNEPKQANSSPGWFKAILVYRQWRVLSMLLFGFSAGLPFFLVFSTLSAWLRQEGVERSTIGMLSWVSLIYTVKFLWSPIVDRWRLPLLHALLGRRRSWILLAQAGLAFGLFNLSLANPAQGVTYIALWALFVAFCAATQDIAIDAWRIESAPTEMQGAMAAAYQLGYRAALIVGSAGVMTIAGGHGWHVGYAAMAALVGIGVITTLLSKEPHPRVVEAAEIREERVRIWIEERAHWPAGLRNAGAKVFDAVVCPLIDFFQRYGALTAVLALLFVSTYRLTEYIMGPMANSFYIDTGFTLSQIAKVVKVFGLATSMIGVLLAGVVIAKLGVFRALILGSAMIMASNCGFAYLAHLHRPDIVVLASVNSLDNLAQAMHGTSLIAFISSLTSPKYTATQYALFTSLYALLGKILEGFSGFVVDAIGYRNFFLYAASMSIPALIVIAALRKRAVFAKANGENA
ncbi:MAG TPA: MFS transporter [Steroidobacteraceae bacterium]|nr:MFS transporter [Steroidobacteraceae bacterium]